MTDEVENPMVVDDENYDFFDQLFGPSFMSRYPVRRCTDVRVSPRYL